KADEFAMPEDPVEAVAQFSAWSWRVAYFQSLARIKRRQRDRLQFDEELVAQLADAAVERLIAYDERRLALLECLKRLSDQDRALIQRRYGDDAEPQCIAEEFGRTRRAVNQALYRIRQALLGCVQQSL